MKTLDDLIKVDEGKISTTVLQLYNKGIAVEPAGVINCLICLGSRCGWPRTVFGTNQGEERGLPHHWRNRGSVPI